MLIRLQGFEGSNLLCRNIQKEAERQEKTALEAKNKAKAMAVALQTIGKFVIKKKVGENDKIFGRQEHLRSHALVSHHRLLLPVPHSAHDLIHMIHYTRG